MWMYDLTGGARIGKLHKRLSKDAAVEHMPTLPAGRLAGAYLYYDAAADDARLTLALARTRSEEHTSELQSLMRISYAGLCLKKKTQQPHAHDLTYIRIHKDQNN